ncbi:MAG: hypothetical protein V4505_03505 [Pseudomonadota bacterium]
MVAILPGLQNSFMTCLAGAVVNFLYERLHGASASAFPRRVVLGYLGAALVVIVVFPWLQARANQTEKRKELHE